MIPGHVRQLRELAAQRSGVLLPGVPDALAARVAADLGFSALYLTGAGVTNTHLGLPDLGFLDLSQLASHVLAIRGVTELPLIVDADTGFGNALNVAHTVRTLEQAGASAIQIEDQRAPKRCGHFAGKELISTEEMVGKIRAAVDARRDDMVVIARTDAIAVEGLEAALDRARRYIEAGADMTFVEAPPDRDALAAIPRQLNAPQMLNMVLGGKTPILSREEAADLGFALVVYANAALQGAIQGMQTALRSLRDQGVLNESAVTSFAERQRLVGKPLFDELERRYAAP
jgi:2-methylisocitrate lyase-like PEP mutase family enzyme